MSFRALSGPLRPAHCSLSLCIRGCVPGFACLPITRLVWLGPHLVAVQWVGWLGGVAGAGAVRHPAPRQQRIWAGKIDSSGLLVQGRACAQYYACMAGWDA